MYMSGRSLFPLSISLAQKLSEAFDGKLQISYSGGADIFNSKEIFDLWYLANHYGNDAVETWWLSTNESSC